MHLQSNPTQQSHHYPSLTAASTHFSHPHAVLLTLFSVLKSRIPGILKPHSTFWSVLFPGFCSGEYSTGLFGGWCGCLSKSSFGLFFPRWAHFSGQVQMYSLLPAQFQVASLQLFKTQLRQLWLGLQPQQALRGSINQRRQQRVTP